MIYDLKDLTHAERTILQARCVGGTKFYSNRKWFEPVVVKLQRIVGKTNKAREKSTRWFVSSTAKVLRNKGEGFILSLHPSWFTDTKQGIGYKNSYDIVHMLEKSGYIDIYRGFVGCWEADGNGSYFASDTHSSVVVIKDTYRSLWECVDVTKIPPLQETDIVVIRDRETKETLSLRGRGGVKELKELVAKLNEKLAGVSIKIKGKECAVVEYRRIFSDDLNSDGRFYVIGGGVQTAPAILRQVDLTIDESKTVELDFKAMHPNMMFELMNDDEYGGELLEILGEGFSPYDADLNGLIELDHEAINKQCEILGVEKYDPVRNLKKQALLVMLNAKSEAAARGALCQKLANDSKKPDAIDKLFVGIKGKVPVNEIMQSIIDHNAVIEDYFFKDCGVGLMNMDSKIAERVVDFMLQEDQPVLVYHDSFIVKEEAEEALYDAMVSAWKSVMGGTKFCAIEKK